MPPPPRRAHNKSAFSVALARSMIYNPRWEWKKQRQGRWLGRTRTTHRGGDTIQRVAAIRQLSDGLAEWSLVVEVRYGDGRPAKKRRWAALEDDVPHAKKQVIRVNRGIGALGAR